jgi:hypothetical protein
MMAHEHPLGIPDAYDRSASAPAREQVVWPEGRFIQGADLTEAASLERRRNRRAHNLVAKDGDRVEGAEILVDIDGDLARLGAGLIYVDGDVRPVAAAVLTGVNYTGEITIGVRLQRTIVTHEDDASLLGLHPGSWAEGEPGAVRVHATLVWALETDEQDGDYYPVYLIKDGAVIDQKPPPALTGIAQQIAVYDRDANGSYIVDGCEVIALGKVGSDQVFAIQAGTANINGFKRIRETALRHLEPEAPDLESIAAEPHTFTGTTGGSTVVTVSRPPINAVSSAIVVKRVTEVVTRGAVPGGSDDLQFSSVVEIESITQGGTTYTSPADFTLVADAVSWAPGGAEPAAASTYSVTYLYNAAVTPTAVTDTTLTVSGGVNGRPVLVSYTSKLPRTDLLCLDQSGRPAYVKGLSGRTGRLPPITPRALLKLAEVSNTWLGAPTITNNGTRNYTYDAQRRLFNRLISILDQFDRSEAERDILAREPVSKAGIFTDTFVDDFYRDQGAAQTAACNRGVLQLAIDNVLMQAVGTTPLHLPYTEEIVLRQSLRTSGMLINPYANFTAMPAGMRLTPAVDFWTEEAVNWASPTTMEFTAAPDQPPGQETINEVTQIRREDARFLRTIDVDVRIEGFGVGENLSTLTFDDIDIMPGGGPHTADAQGVIEVTFTIPSGVPAGRRLVRADGAAGSFAEAMFAGSGVPAGRRLVRADGAAGSFAEAMFAGEGTIDITTMRRITLVTRAAPVPPVIEQPQPDPRWPVVVTEWVPANFSEAIWGDPLAQTFVLPAARHIVGVNFAFTAIGDPTEGVRVQLANVVNGYPGPEVYAEAFINMQTVEVGDVVEARFDAPVFCPPDREFCFVFMTADNAHALATCRLGDVDPVTQQRVASQPYTVGVLFSSANRRAWTAHQDADLFFEVVCASFSATSLTQNLWTGNVTNLSDFMVRGAVELPTNDARFRYEVLRATGQVIQLTPGQNYEFDEFVTEEITVRAVLTGTAEISPLLYPGTLIAGGRIATTGTYISRQFPMGTAIKVAALFAALQPAGSSVAVHVDAVDNSWQALSSAGSSDLGGGWTEPRFEKDPFTAVNGRVRITLTGGPGARPAVARLRAYSV